jgi:hypothetical protein
LIASFSDASFPEEPAPFVSRELSTVVLPFSACHAVTRRDKICLLELSPTGNASVG